jgi:O-antigen ligase
MTTTEDAQTLSPPPAAGFDWPLMRQRWAAVIMLVCVGLAGPIGYAGQLGYSALIALAGIASLPLLGVKRQPMWEVLILLGLVSWCCISMGWSIAAPVHVDFHRYKQVESVTALKLVLEVGLYGAFASLMRELPWRWAGRIMATLAVSLLVMAVLMAIDALTGEAIYRALRLSAHAVNKPEILQRNAARGTYTLAVLFWPAVLWMRRSGWMVPLGLMVICGLVAAIGLNVDAPIAAVILGGLAMAAVRQWGRPAIWALLLGTLAYFALAPMIVDFVGPHLPAMHNASGVAKESWSARVGIWRFTADKIAEKPWLGWGMDASRMFDPIPLHPHNAALQLWLEIGAVGVALAALFWAYMWARLGVLAEESRSNAGVAAAVAVAYLTIGGLSFGVWQEWWLALGVLAAVVCWVFTLVFRDWAPDRRGLEELTPLS